VVGSQKVPCIYNLIPAGILSFLITIIPNLISKHFLNPLKYPIFKHIIFKHIICKHPIFKRLIFKSHSYWFIGRPEPVTKCTSSNHGFTSFLIKCTPGYDGGLQQSFALELYDNKDEKLVLNLTNSDVSSFDLSSLQPGTVYDIKVFSVNVKGRSEPFFYSTQTSTPPIVLEGIL